MEMCTHHNRRRMLISKIHPKETCEHFLLLRIFLVFKFRTSSSPGRISRSVPASMSEYARWQLLESLQSQWNQNEKNETVPVLSIFSMVAVKLKPAASSASSSQLSPGNHRGSSSISSVRKSMESEVCCSYWHCCHLNKTIHKWTAYYSISFGHIIAPCDAGKCNNWFINGSQFLALM